MTRPGKRELENRVEDLTQDRPETPRKWIEQEVLRRVTESDGEVGLLRDHDGPDGDGVVIFVSVEDREYGHPREEIPAWIDVEEDLPVYGEEDKRNPFILADFTGGNT
jgi:hypothetical protein